MAGKMLTDLESTERARALAAATNNVEFSMRDFLTDTYLRLIPVNCFCKFWCALGCVKGGFPIVKREKFLSYLGACGDAAHLNAMTNEAFYNAVYEACGVYPSEELRRNVIGCLDITGFFKFEFLNQALLGGTSVYTLLAQKYPLVAKFPEEEWNHLCELARKGRNDQIGHPNSHTYRDMSPADWETAMQAWLQIADCLHDEHNDPLYTRLQADAERVKSIFTFSLISLQELSNASGYFSPDDVRTILQQYHYECNNGKVYCNKDVALHCLSEAARNQNIEKIIEKLLKDKAHARAQIPKAAEAAVTKAALETRLQNVPPVKDLVNVNSQPLTGRTLQELVSTHYIVLTASLLKNPDGRNFVSSQLLPMLKLAHRDFRDALIVDSTTMFHLFEDRENYSKAAEQCRSPLWAAQPESERIALEQRCKELRNADSAYYFVQSLKIPTLGSPDPLSSDEESLLSIMESHPFDRFCVLLCGAAGIVKKIDRQHLPFVLVARVRGGAERPVCTLFPQLLPPAISDKTEPLLATLISDYEKRLNEQPPAPRVQPKETSEKEDFQVSSPDAPDLLLQMPIPTPISNRKNNGEIQHATNSFPPNPSFRKMDNRLLPCPVSPLPGLVLYTEDGEKVILKGALMEGKEEAFGGEGNLFLTDMPGQVAKIYNAEHLTIGRHDKLAEMLSHDPRIDNLCWPTHMLYTYSRDFVGYTMPKAPDGALPFSKSVLLIGNPSVRAQLLPHWDRLDLVQAARSAAAIVSQLHRCNILMGDVNAGNFMIDPQNSSSVYLVDSDSFQFGGFPCPVGVEDFTHPGTARRIGAVGPLKYDTFLRTEDEENYVLAIFIFKVLFLNQNPFVTKTKMTYREAMAQRKFSYALQGDDFNVPDGDNWMIWKNLPRNLTDAFTAAFTRWECASASDWVRLLDGYRYRILNNGFSRELAPTKYHEFHPEDPFFVDVVCPYCHREFNMPKTKYARIHDELHKPIFCRNCRSLMELRGKDILKQALTCSRCGRTYDATVRECIYVESGLRTSLCPSCKQRRFGPRGR